MSKVQFQTNDVSNQQAVKKKSGCLKYLAIGLIVFFFIFVVKLCSGENDIKSKNKTENKESVSKKNPIQVLDNLIKSINNDKDEYSDSMDNVTMYLVMFKGFGDIYSQYESDKNPEVQKKLEILKSSAGKYQKRLLPKMRRTYAKTLKEKLWRSNIDVEHLGGNITTLQFTGGSLANNANKQDLMDTISEVVNELRFKKINMKWYKFDDEYTYYKLDTDQDSKLYK